MLKVIIILGFYILVAFLLKRYHYFLKERKCAAIRPPDEIELGGPYAL